MVFLVILGQALLAHLVPCWWVGWWLWRAGCISQDTCLLYVLHLCTYMYNLFHGRKTGPTLRSTTALAACLASFPPTPAVWPGFVICLYLCDFSFDITNLITNLLIFDGKENNFDDCHQFWCIPCSGVRQRSNLCRGNSWARHLFRCGEVK